MNEETLTNLIDILVRRCRWIDYDSLSHVLKACGSKPAEIASILRYGTRKKLLVCHAVNCGPVASTFPICKQVNGLLPKSVVLAKRLALDSVTPFKPTRFMAGSRLVAGLFGVEVCTPKSTMEWQAHLRIGKALTYHVHDQSVPISQWRILSDDWRTKHALWASIRETIVCVPIVSDRESLGILLEQLSWTGETYEFW